MKHHQFFPLLEPMAKVRRLSLLIVPNLNCSHSVINLLLYVKHNHPGKQAFMSPLVIGELTVATYYFPNF